MEHKGPIWKRYYIADTPVTRLQLLTNVSDKIAVPYASLRLLILLLSTLSFAFFRFASTKLVGCSTPSRITYFEVWDGIVSLQRVQSWWYSKSMISKSRVFQWCIICGFISIFYNLYMFKVAGLRRYNFTLTCPSNHGDIQNLQSSSQELSNDVSYVGLSEKILIFICLRVSGLRWCSFTCVCPIKLIFTISDLQAKSFPKMYHMFVYPKTL